MIKLGDKVRDVVTNLEGIVVAETKWLNGCYRFTIQPQVIKDGEPVKTSTFDVEELVLLEENAVKLEGKAVVTNGPMPGTPKYSR